MEQSRDAIYLNKASADNSKWIYYRILAIGEKSAAGSGQFECCRVTWPTFVDIANDKPSDELGAPITTFGFVAFQHTLKAMLRFHYGIDHDASFVIGALDSLPRRRH